MNQPMNVDQALAHLERLGGHRNRNNAGRRINRRNQRLHVAAVLPLQNDNHVLPHVAPVVDPLPAPPRPYHDFIPDGEFIRRIVFFRGEQMYPTHESAFSQFRRYVFACIKFVFFLIVSCIAHLLCALLGLVHPVMFVSLYVSYMFSSWLYHRLFRLWIRNINIGSEMPSQHLMRNGTELLKGSYDSEEFVHISNLVYQELHNVISASNLTSPTAYQRCMVQVNKMMINNQLPHLKDNPDRYRIVSDTITVFLQDLSIERARISNRMPINFGITVDDLSN